MDDAMFDAHLKRNLLSRTVECPVCGAGIGEACDPATWRGGEIMSPPVLAYHAARYALVNLKGESDAELQVQEHYRAAFPLADAEDDAAP